jgi:hypothetical protein
MQYKECEIHLLYSCVLKYILVVAAMHGRLCEAARTCTLRGVRNRVESTHAMSSLQKSSWATPCAACLLVAD